MKPPADQQKDEQSPAIPVVRLRRVSLHYRKQAVLSGIDLDIPKGGMTGLIGPDGVGKSSLLALISGARVIQQGEVRVLGGDMSDARHRNRICPQIAYMPQGLGKNLYPTLSVFENVDFFGRLFGHAREERERRIAELLAATGLASFADRPAGKLSGGMKQKLGLCCALIHDPDLLILDEPTTGVDPLSRRQFWELIERIRRTRPEMSVLVATAYMEEAARFDWLVAMNGGEILATGTPDDLLQRTDSASLDTAFIKLLPEYRTEDTVPVVAPGSDTTFDGDDVAIEAQDLTMRFGDFTAVDRVSFRIGRGEIFGFVGSNGCGKTTTMKMLTGLLPPREGQAWLFGHPLDPHDMNTRRRVGYMTQSFSLYSELSVEQNLILHGRLFGLTEDELPQRVESVAESFGLKPIMDSLPDDLPLGVRQRLSLAVAMIHGPEILILDEPTSGVDPVARDSFWKVLIRLAREDNVTIFISTHLMNEAERCDRIALMHAGRVLVTATPSAIESQRNAEHLEAAFIGYLEDEVARLAGLSNADTNREEDDTLASQAPVQKTSDHGMTGVVSLRRLFSYTRREALELRRDPIRLTMAMLGSAILMLVLGYGISLDVEDLNFAVIDRDQTTVSRDYILNLAGSRYFNEQPPALDYEDLDRRMRAGEISLAIEIPPGFARDLARGKQVKIGAWIDGAMPTRAETVSGYVQGMHQHWLMMKARQSGQQVSSGLVDIEIRYRYNPDIESLQAMVPAAIPLLLMMLPAMLAALSVVREKELGSIINFYVTPVSSLEFLLGKQIPYVVLIMISFGMLTLMAIFLFGVPLKGSFLTLATGALLYITSATALGMVMSAFTRSQVAALFGTALLTVLPAVEFSGLVEPVSSLQGAGRVIGEIYPTTHFLVIARGTFSKGLDFAHLQDSFIPLIIAVPVLIAVGALLLRKQES